MAVTPSPMSVTVVCGGVTSTTTSTQTAHSLVFLNVLLHTLPYSLE